MNYFIVKLIGGDKMRITEEEYKKMAGKTGLVFIPSIGETVNLQSVSRIYPEERDVKEIDRTKQCEGVTSNGEIVIKRFGHWYFRDVNEYQRDDEGRSILEYHGAALLPTPEEYETDFKHIASEEWTQKLIKRADEIDERLLLERDHRSTGGYFETVSKREER